ncbi:hypothetical protein [Winogradskyella helgolandensis]|uniref:hypothetical protein n=1 Tax=Winogradskyella helgolandensis TaxID=2697010 RepID=UPI0015B81F71|nr:hypothetical protein [Winogradskyella helgolandensis]
MIKTKDTLILVFVIALIFVIGLTSYFIYNIQNTYSKPSYSENYIEIKTRYLYGFVSDSLMLRTEYRLTKTENNSTIGYNYISETDVSRNFKITYNLKIETLIFDIGAEYEISKFKVLSDLDGNWFDSYMMIEPIIDGVGPILFNKDYGVLAFTNALSPSVFFISEKDNLLFVKQIEEKLYQ